MRRCHRQNTPMCRKLKNGIENVFVDEETILPCNNKISVGSGKIRTIGKVTRIQAHRKQDGVS